MGSETQAAADEDGLRIVLTPVQLAAVLQGDTVFEKDNVWGRVGGGLTLLGGALELAGSAALLLTPEPTMATKVGGWALAVHGSDTAAAGLTQLWTGRPQATLTAQLSSAAARLAGVSPERANQFGTAVDVLVPIIVAGALAAARAVAVRRGIIDLEAHEATALRRGGHTLREHVGKTEAELRARLARQPAIPAASTFASRNAAERAVSEVMRIRARDIANWARTAPLNAPPKAFTADLGRVIGHGVVRSTGQLTRMTAVRVVLRRTTVDGRAYFVLTAFPVP